MLKSKARLIAQLLQPRMILLVWLFLGSVGLLFVLISSFSSNTPEKLYARQAATIASDLLVEDMARLNLTTMGRKAPAVMFMGPDGPVDLQEFHGKILVVNLWATWCAPCLEELPSLDRLQQAYGVDDLMVVAIAADPKAAEGYGLTFLEKLGVSLPLYTDGTLRFAMAYESARHLPLTILYDRQGREVGQLAGKADWSGPAARRLFDQLVSGRYLQ